MSIFRSAITDRDGTVNVGYLSLFMLMGVVIGVVPVMSVGGFLTWWKVGTFPIQDLGVGTGSACTGFGAALAALGVYMHMDRPTADTTTSHSESMTTTSEPK